MEPPILPTPPPAWRTRLSWEQGLAAAWVLGIAAMAFRYALGVLCLWRTGRKARPVEDQRWRTLLEETARRSAFAGG